MKIAPLVSIIIPTYNRIDLLQQTLDSILNQTYVNFEVIIISDASPDNTSQVIETYNDHRIRFYELKENLKYPSRVRNIGLKKAKGEFIAFCDDDDLWVSEKLEIQIHYLLKHESINMIATNSYLFPGYILPSMQLWKNKVLTYKKLLKVNYIITPSVLIRKSTLDNIGDFDENEMLHIGEDWDLWIRVLQYKEKSIVILKNCLVWNRLDNVKITNSHNDPQRLTEAKLYIYEKHKPKTNDCIYKMKNRVKTLDSNTKNVLLQQISRDLYTKNMSIIQLSNSHQINLIDKLLILIKLLTKKFYKFIVQN